MIKYIEFIHVPKQEAERIDFLLMCEPESREECFGEDETIVYTKKFFASPMEMDIKLCGVQYEEGSSNLPWAEAVLFCNGSEVACSEVGDEFFGAWELEYDGIIYRCVVERG